MSSTETAANLPDEILDAIATLIDDNPDRTWTPSQVARKAHTTTTNATEALHYLVQHRMADADERGAWTRYTARRRTLAA